MSKEKKKTGLASLFIAQKNHYVVTPVSKFLRTEFDYEIFAEFQDSNIAYMFGGYMRFCYIFQQLIPQSFPSSKISHDFSELKQVLKYVENSHSELEVIFYCKAIRKFIDFNLKTNYKYIRLYIKGYKITKYTNDILSIFSLQLKALINFIETKSYDDAPEENPKKIKAHIQPSLEVKINEVKKIIGFLKGQNPHKGNIEYASKEDYNLIEEYIIEFIKKGELNNVPKKISKIHLDERSISYTFYLINNYLFNRFRNPKLFEFIINAFEQFSKYKDMDYMDTYLYKHFKDKPKSYNDYNKYILPKKSF